jgi:hypothetical protein
MGIYNNSSKKIDGYTLIYLKSRLTIGLPKTITYILKNHHQTLKIQPKSFKQQTYTYNYQNVFKTIANQRVNVLITMK